MKHLHCFILKKCRARERKGRGKQQPSTDDAEISYPASSPRTIDFCLQSDLMRRKTSTNRRNASVQTLSSYNHLRFLFSRLQYKMLKSIRRSLDIVSHSARLDLLDFQLWMGRAHLKLRWKCNVLNNSPLWQDCIFHVLAVLYGIVAVVALIQGIKIQQRVPKYHWTTQKKVEMGTEFLAMSGDRENNLRVALRRKLRV